VHALCTHFEGAFGHQERGPLGGGGYPCREKIAENIAGNLEIRPAELPESFVLPISRMASARGSIF